MYGVITRNRITKDSTEISVLDYIICCEKLAVFLESMLIDEKRNFPLTKYASKKGNQKIVVSDHNTLYARFKMEYADVTFKKPKHEIFNLKNEACQKKFTNVTTDSVKLRKCFQSNNSFKEQSNKFFKTLDDFLHQCFKKIKIKKGNNKSIAQDL